MKKKVYRERYYGKAGTPTEKNDIKTKDENKTDTRGKNDDKSNK